MNNNRVSDIRFFVKNITPLRDTSKDNEKYMTDSQIPAINFDAVKLEYFRSFKKRLNTGSTTESIDALVLQDNNVWAFIEFKNGKNIDSKSLRLKIKSSLLIFCNITKTDLSFTREKLDLYVIYNHQYRTDKNTAQEKIANSIAEKSKKEKIDFGLSMYEIFFRNVHTYSDIKFKDVVKNLVPISSDTIINVNLSK